MIQCIGTGSQAISCAATHTHCFRVLIVIFKFQGSVIFCLFFNLNGPFNKQLKISCSQPTRLQPSNRDEVQGPKKNDEKSTTVYGKHAHMRCFTSQRMRPSAKYYMTQNNTDQYHQRICFAKSLPHTLMSNSLIKYNKFVNMFLSFLNYITPFLTYFFHIKYCTKLSPINIS